MTTVWQRNHRKRQNMQRGHVKNASVALKTNESPRTAASPIHGHAGQELGVLPRTSSMHTDIDLGSWYLRLPRSRAQAILRGFLSWIFELCGWFALCIVLSHDSHFPVSADCEKRERRKWRLAWLWLLLCLEEEAESRTQATLPFEMHFLTFGINSSCWYRD